MSLSKIIATCFFVLSTLVFQKLHANEEGQCDSVLIKQSSVLIVNSHSQLSWLKIVSKSNYEEAKRSAEGQAYADLFGGSYDEFIVKRNQLFTKETFSSSLRKARNEFKSFLSDAQINAWRSCMIGKRAEIFSYFKDIDDTAATLVVEWHVSPAIGRLESITPEIFGGISNSLDMLESLSGQNSFVLVRKTAGSSLRGVIRGTAGVNDQNYSTHFFLPKYSKPTPSQKKLSVGSCVGHGGVNGVRFWGPREENCNGISGWGKYNKYGITITGANKICKCVGHGGVEGVELWGPEGKACGGIPGWGSYSAGCVAINNADLCSCKGNGNILGGMDLWGPENNYCGGFSGWGMYNSYCK